MDIYGKVGTQRAPSESGEELSYGPFYHRSASLKEIDIPFSGERLCWVLREEVREGNFRFTPNEDRGCISTRRDPGRFIRATFLEKVRLSDDNKPCPEGFYPVIERLMMERRNWGVEFSFRGLSIFIPCLMEWTEQIMVQYKSTLQNVGIFGLVGISCLPFSYQTEVWRAFCELWSPLTNTFHHGGGEIGVSLNYLAKTWLAYFRGSV